MADETLSISLKADTRELINSLKELPGISAQEARNMVRGLQREYRQAERAAKRTAQVTQKEFERGFQGIGKAVKAFEGQIGGAFSVFEDFTEGLGQASGLIGPLGTALGGAALGASAAAFAVAGLGSMALDFARSAVEANDRLVEMGMASSGSTSDVEDLGDALDALSVAGDSLRVNLVAATPQLEDFIQTLAGGLFILSEASDSVGGIVDKLELFTRIAGAGLTFGASEAIRYGFSEAEAAGESLQHRVADVAEETEQLGQEPVRVVEDLRDTMRQARQAAADTAREAARVAAEMAAWRSESDALQQLIDDMNSDQMDDLQQIRVRYQSLREEVVARAGDEGLASDAIVAINEREAREVQALYDERSKAADEMWAAIVSGAEEASGEAEAAAERIGEATTQAAQDATKAWQQHATDVSSALMGVAGDVLSSFSTLNDMRIAELQEQAAAEVAAAQQANEAWERSQLARIERDMEAGRISAKEAAAQRREIAVTAREREKAARKLARDERRAAMKSWRANQTIARTQAIMSAAQNAVTLTPAFAFLGPGAPIAAAALATTSLLPQLAVINRQSPPEFPSGGMVSPDHTIIGAQVGEGVATRTGVAAMGGPEALERYNRGERAGGDRIIVQLGRRTLAEAVRDVQRDTRSVMLDPRLGQADPNTGSGY